MKYDSMISADAQDVFSGCGLPLQEACDAASCDIAREKWLHLEIERQRRRADAAAEDVHIVEQEKEQLLRRVSHLEVSNSITKPT